ncbi:MAG TPA: hypothetical protein VGH22_03720 [Candidatus Binatia bacterium]
MATRYIDFALIGASVFDTSMGTGLRKIAIAVGLLFLVTLGGVALSVAHDTLVPQGDLLFRGVNFPYVLAHPSGGAVGTGLDCDTCDAPALSIGLLQTSRPQSLPRSTRNDGRIYFNPYTAKISLHLLDSVLLI